MTLLKNLKTSGCALFLTATFTATSLMAGDGAGVMDIRLFQGIYEPSAAVTLADNRLAIFEDEGEAVISLYKVVEDKKGPLLQRVKVKFPELKVSDIEGATMIGGRIMAVTSHSLTKKGERKKKREKLVVLASKPPFSVKSVQESGLYEPLRHYLKKNYSMGEKQLDGINIEGVAYDKKNDWLLLGLRTPTHREKAVVVAVSSPGELGVKKGAPDLIEKQLLLDLGGAGVRAFSYDAVSKKYYLATEVENKKGKMRSRIFLWDGIGSQPVRMKAKGLKKLTNIEGITPLTFKGKRMLLLVCDDGNRKKKEGASYALVELDSLAKAQ